MTAISTRARVTGWGRLAWASVEACNPAQAADVVQALAEPTPRGVIPFGNGRSYGDQALNDNGRIVAMRGLNRLVDFDPASGEAVCEAGMTLSELFDRSLPAGFMPAVSPGTGKVTVGGAIANDVHGKNHESAGSFGDHVAWLDLALSSGRVVRVSRTEHPEWFAATVAGAGLTGTILRAALRLAPVRSNAVVVREERVASLDGFLERFEAVRHTSTYSVAWIDALASGARLGRGILETAEPSDANVADESGQRLSMPFDLPRFTLNPVSIRLFNTLYYARIPRGGRTRRLPIRRFLYPLDAIGNWNRMYGKRGFYQFQCVLPDAGARAGLRRLLATIAERRAASFLAVLKTLGGDGQGLLSFPTRGYTLALDFPNRPGTKELLGDLECITADHGGRVYLAKDCALSAAGFRRMYPRLADFQRVLDDVDPERRMMSDMARRLELRSSIA